MKSTSRVRRFVSSLPLLVAFVAVPSFAAAPGNPDPQYGSFDQNARVIKDRKTGLEWRRPVLLDAVKGAAEFHCETQAFGSNVGRLPTFKELMTIFDEEPHLEYIAGKNVRKHLDQDAFGFDQANNDFSPVDNTYWSQTPATAAGTFWTLDFATGAMVPKTAAQNAHVRCVR